MVNPELVFETTNRRNLDEALERAFTYALQLTEALKQVGVYASCDADLPLVAKVETWRAALREIWRGKQPEETSADNGLVNFVRRGRKRQGWPNAD